MTFKKNNPAEFNEILPYINYISQIFNQRSCYFIIAYSYQMFLKIRQVNLKFFQENILIQIDIL